MRTRLLSIFTRLAVAVLSASYAACGGVTAGTSGNGGTGGAEGHGVGGSVGHGGSGGSSGHKGTGGTGGQGGTKASGGSSGHGGSRGMGGHSDAGGPSDAVGGGPVDAGYYYGDGSFWVEGGAYPDVGAPDASSGKDAAIPGDASGCGALSACCTSLSGATQAACNAVVATGNAADCSAELTLLEGGGNCTGVTIVASMVQSTPNRLVSDGTLLFWTTTATPALQAVPVRGGAITTVLTGPIQNKGGELGQYGDTFLAVDDLNVYVLENTGIVRIPKNGDPATLVNESGVIVIDATSLGSTAYWVETPMGIQGPKTEYPVRSAPLKSAAVAWIAQFTYPGSYVTNAVSVTSGTVFVGTVGGALPQLFEFPLSTGVPAGGVVPVAPTSSCDFLTSDTDAIYCSQGSGSNLRIASDGTTTSLGAALSSSYVVFDDTYAYWADMTTVGTIMKAPKAGGATATILARDTSPTAIAVDSTSVYWADMSGYIKSVPK